MPTPVTLPQLAWGDPAAPRRALLIHGLGGNAALMWRYGVELAGLGWHAIAVDLRGHGLAPRALDYSIDAYATDVAATRPGETRTGDEGTWDLVIGHSLGAAVATRAAADHVGWTRRLVLIDPAIRLGDRDRDIVRNSQERSFADPTESAVRAEHPAWHEHDIELKARAAQQASRWAVEQTSAQNTPWDVTSAAARLAVPTRIIASDPNVYSIFKGRLVDDVLANRRISMTVVPGSGHNTHRDKPEDTMRHLRDAIGALS
jgi:pimeloyl-ACP methyl ester carboxylesterase